MKMTPCLLLETPLPMVKVGTISFEMRPTQESRSICWEYQLSSGIRRLTSNNPVLGSIKITKRKCNMGKTFLLVTRYQPAVTTSLLISGRTGTVVRLQISLLPPTETMGCFCSKEEELVERKNVYIVRWEIICVIIVTSHPFQKNILHEAPEICQGEVEAECFCCRCLYLVTNLEILTLTSSSDELRMYGVYSSRDRGQDLPTLGDLHQLWEVLQDTIPRLIWRELIQILSRIVM